MHPPIFLEVLRIYFLSLQKQATVQNDIKANYSEDKRFGRAVNQASLALTL